MPHEKWKTDAEGLAGAGLAAAEADAAGSRPEIAAPGSAGDFILLAFQRAAGFIPAAFFMR